MLPDPRIPSSGQGWDEGLAVLPCELHHFFQGLLSQVSIIPCEMQDSDSNWDVQIVSYLGPPHECG